MFMTEEESEYFLSFINSSCRVLEYGSGESTNEIGSRCRSLVSVEHQKEWFDKVSTGALHNCTLLYNPPDLPYREGSSDGTYEQFLSYVTAPVEYGPFDVVLLDGRCRVACAKLVKTHWPTAKVFIHDFEREEYQEVLNSFELIKLVGKLARLNAK